MPPDQINTGVFFPVNCSQKMQLRFYTKHAYAFLKGYF